MVVRRDGDGPARHSLIRRVLRFDLPPPGFVPNNARPGELERYGIIPKPNREQHPELYWNWLHLFRAPIKFVRPEYQEVRSAWQLNPSPARPPVSGGSRIQESGNWSGGYLVPTHDNMAVVVAGQWTLPMLRLPPPEYTRPSDTEYVCSTWVGLDGQRRYIESSLPQIGVMQTLTLMPTGPAQNSVTAFMQWWDRENTGSYLKLTHPAAQPGDTMTGAIWAFTASLAVGYLRNDSTGEMIILGLTAPEIPPPGGGALFELTISGATAEWVLERPTEFGSTELYPFPDYSKTTFHWCWSATAHDAGPPTGSHDLLRARYIRMYDTLLQPTRTMFTSMPHRMDETSFKLNYGSFRIG